MNLFYQQDQKQEENLIINDKKIQLYADNRYIVENDINFLP